MKNIASTIFVATAVQNVALAAPAVQGEHVTKRLENGLGRTPELGYNNWVSACDRRGLMVARLLIYISRTMAAAHMLLQIQLSRLLISWSH
jgi:hypothetical protein